MLTVGLSSQPGRHCRAGLSVHLEARGHLHATLAILGHTHPSGPCAQQGTRHTTKTRTQAVRGLGAQWPELAHVEVGLGRGPAPCAQHCGCWGAKGCPPWFHILENCSNPEKSQDHQPLDVPMCPAWAAWKPCASWSWGIWGWDLVMPWTQLRLEGASGPHTVS